MIRRSIQHGIRQCTAATGVLLVSVLWIAGVLNEAAHADDFVCLAVLPEIQGVTPVEAPPGTPVTITGANFQPPPCLYDVTFGSTSAPFVWLGGNTIVATVPDLPPGAYDVRVRIHVGGSSEPFPFTVTEVGPVCPDVPFIDGVDPAVAPSGANVTIQGTGFLPAPCLEEVTFRGVPSPAFAWLDAETIAAQVPDLSDGPAAVQVVQDGVPSNEFDAFDVDNGGFVCLAALPQINAVTPGTAPPFAVVVITGVLFQTPPCLYDVTFGGTSSPAFGWLNNNTIAAMVPNLTPGSAPVRVHIHVGGTSNAFPFTVAAAPGCGAVPQISGVSPDPASPSTLVTIEGSGFEPPPCLIDVTFDGVSSEFTFIDQNTIVAEVPEVSGLVPVVVEQEGGSSNAYELEVVSAACLAVLPEITAITPPASAPLTEVTISGTSFQDEPCLYSVTFGGTASPDFQYVDTNTILATVPVRPPGSAPVRVHIHVGGTSEPHDFSVLCPGDANGDGEVNVLDLLAVILDWGECPGCPTDLNDDGVVDVLDLLEVILGWGPC